MIQKFLNCAIELRPGDCRDVIHAMPDNSIDSIVTDPPYALVSIVKRFGGENAAPPKDYGDGNGLAAYARAARGFMGKQWDTGETAFAVEFWAEIMRVLKPGGHVVAFSGTRSYHRLACAIEDSGFEIRDMLAWTYGSGFPKSHDISKAIDKAAGNWRGRAGAIKERTVGQSAKGTEYERAEKGEPVTPEAVKWQGFGTALKPALEPICLARKPLSEKTVAANVLKWGTGALNIDGCRVDLNGEKLEMTRPAANPDADKLAPQTNRSDKPFQYKNTAGRWPANFCHDGSDEVLAMFPETSSGASKSTYIQKECENIAMSGKNYERAMQDRDASSGSAARFFYSAKADKLDRIGSKHPTVKPVDLMQWLCRLVTPLGGTILDPFAGSGSTGEAAWREGFKCILIEREAEYQADIAARLNLADKGPGVRKQRAHKQVDDHGPLFGGMQEALV
jgi:site-specific DNA-methyltransferase (adenine-specific)